MLSFTGKKETEYTLLPEGVYEVTLTAEWKKSSTDPNTKNINLKFTVRGDVEGQEDTKGMVVFDAIYKSKTTGDYNKGKINGILSTIPNLKTEFEDYDELIQYINGKDMKIEVQIEPANEYHAKDKNIVKFGSWEQTDFPRQTKAEMVEVPADESLPF